MTLGLSARYATLSAACCCLFLLALCVLVGAVRRYLANPWQRNPFIKALEFETEALKLQVHVYLDFKFEVRLLPPVVLLYSTISCSEQHCEQHYLL